jgi:hypothetical protein
MSLCEFFGIEFCALFGMIVIPLGNEIVVRIDDEKVQ